MTLGVYYLACIVSSCHALLLVVNGSEYEVYDLMGKRLGNFASEKVAIGPSKRTKGGLQLALVFDEWAKLEIVLGAADERRLRQMAPANDYRRPKLPYVLAAFAIPLVIVGNVFLLARVARIDPFWRGFEEVLPVLISDAAFLVALLWIRLRYGISLSAILRRLL